MSEPRASQPPSDEPPTQPPRGPGRAPGAPAGEHDKRAQFARVSRGARRDVDAERAFLRNKMEIARTDKALSEAERERAVSELRRMLEQLPDAADQG